MRIFYVKKWLKGVGIAKEDGTELSKQDKIADTLSRLERVIEARKEKDRRLLTNGAAVQQKIFAPQLETGGPDAEIPDRA